MKTLDEVIKEGSVCDEAEHCYSCRHTSAETGCDVNWEGWVSDALYYLREYQARDSMSRRLDLEDNEPLTWDELKQMEGKPVWVEYGINFNQKKWVVISKFHGRKNEFCYMDVTGDYPNEFWEKDMGADEFWQAYRKERTE